MVKKYSIKDIAKAANVSTITVSRALRNSPLVTEKTRSKVEKVAKKLKYTPNLLANGILHGQTRTIGLIVSPYGEFYSNVIIGAHDTLANNNHSLILSCEPIPDARPNPLSLTDCLRRLVERRVDGVIIRLLEDLEPTQHYKFLRERDIPIVFLDSWQPEISNVSVVRSDHFMGGRQAAEAAINAGHKHIGIIQGPSYSRSYQERVDGFLNLLNQVNPKLQPYLVRTETWNFPVNLALDLLQKSPRPSLIFCVNDHAAYPVLEAARKLSLKIPDDLSIIGYGNTRYSKMASPLLTTIDQGAYNIGKAAALALLQLRGIKVEDPFSNIRNAMPTRLVRRESLAHVKSI